jgi:hypothetical protein
LAQNYDASAFAADWALARSIVPEPMFGLISLGSPLLARRR